MNGLILAIFLCEFVIYAATSYVLIKKHSKFPDFSTGYHTSRAQENSKKWEHYNKLSGIVCVIASFAFPAASVLLYIFRAGKSAAIITLFIISVAAVLCVLFIPYILIDRKGKKDSKK